jgi:hypothetical protein
MAIRLDNGEFVILSHCRVRIFLLSVIQRETIMRIRFLATVLLLTALTAHAQTAKPDDGASMVKPPDAASANATRPDNPDNMPVKRPAKPTGSDRMLHHSPASDAIAK